MALLTAYLQVAWIIQLRVFQQNRHFLPFCSPSRSFFARRRLAFSAVKGSFKTFRHEAFANIFNRLSNTTKCLGNSLISPVRAICIGLQ